MMEEHIKTISTNKTIRIIKKKNLIDLYAEKPLYEYNKKIISVLEELIHLTIKNKNKTEDGTKNQFRISSFQKAISAIKNISYEITDIKGLKIPGIGPGILKRINEILLTGTLKEIEEMKLDTDPRSTAILELQKVHGIGEVKAISLVDKFNIYTIDELKMSYKTGKIGVKTNELTEAIVIGLKYYDDMKQRIPWKEVDFIKNLITKILTDYDNKYSIYVCGSYIRKSPTCGDIDVLITHDNIISDEDMKNNKIDHLSIIISLLKDILVAHLTHNGKTKYMGICKTEYSDSGRRIDIRFINLNSLGSALLYFTGSCMFNKIFRAKALEQGYTLNEYRLMKISTEKYIDAKTEQELFAILNFKYLEPENRNW